MNREIKFRAEHLGHLYDVRTRPPLHRDARGWYKNQGYILRLVTEHPFADKRGYVREHRLVIEEHLGAFLTPKQFIHHINQDRADNRLENLVVQGQASHATSHLVGKRNTHGQFVYQEPVFQQIKFRLLNTNTNQMRSYTLQELIATTYRRGQFKYRGKWTGLKDKNGVEIYEGDIVRARSRFVNVVYEVYWEERGCQFRCCANHDRQFDKTHLMDWADEVIGNIYEGLHSGEKCDIIKEWKKNTNEQSQMPSRDTESAEKPEGKSD